jgi:hypothetical protein
MSKVETWKNPRNKKEGMVEQPKTPRSAFTTTRTGLPGSTNNTTIKNSDGVEVYRGENGQMTGVKFPDGRDFKNLSNDQVNSLLGDWNKRPIEPTPTPEPTPNMTPEQAAGFGQLNMQDTLFANNGLDPNSLDIQRKMNTQEKNNADLNVELGGLGAVGNVANALGVSLSVPNPVQAMPNIINAAPNVLGIKNGLKKIVADNKAVTEWLDEYPTLDNYNSITSELDTTDAEIATAMEMAKIYGKGNDAQNIYNHAIAKKTRAYAQLKKLSNTNQEGYAAQYKDSMAKLESYFSTRKAKDDYDIQQLALNAKMKGAMNG